MTDETPDDDWAAQLTPRQIVAELDKYIVGQKAAKKAVAIALRNRWRRQKVEDDLRDEILPGNLILIGPTGVGKTEISRRLARLSGAPFVKVEASKFTEVGYVGRDVESMVRDLLDTAINLVRGEREDEMQDAAEEGAEERLLDLLLPPSDRAGKGKGKGGGVRVETSRVRADRPTGPKLFVAGPGGVEAADHELGQGESRPGEGERPEGEYASREGRADTDAQDFPDREPTLEERRRRTREKLRTLLRDGKLEDRMVEIEVEQTANLDGMMLPMGMEGMDHSFTEMLQDMLPRRTKRRSVRVTEARRILVQEELDRLVDMDEVVAEALDRTEDAGIIFLDEIDKVTGGRGGAGPDVSREGVQRDLLPIVEGSNVQTKYGLVRTDHILFIAAGAFHVAKPSDLIPELQGRFPIRVELRPLEEGDFVRILTEPRNALVEQYRALLGAEGAELVIGAEAVAEIARIATLLNDRMENIGARRLQTVMTTLFEEVLYDLPDREEKRVEVDRDFVLKHLSAIVEDEDLRRYIL